jgi:hypothetical protein
VKQLNVIVRALDSSRQPDVYFALLPTTNLGKLMAAYCERQKLERDETDFTFRGAKLLDGMTPKSMGMKDKDVVEMLPFPLQLVD